MKKELIEMEEKKSSTHHGVLTNEDGQTSTAYYLLVAIIALGVIVILDVLGKRIEDIHVAVPEQPKKTCLS